ATVSAEINGTRNLREQHIGYAPIPGDLPWLNGIPVVSVADRFQAIPLTASPVPVQLGERRLHFTLVIGAPGHDHRFFSIPGPVEAKPGMCHGKDGLLELCLFPGLAAIDGYIYLADPTPTRPCQAGNLIIAGRFQPESGRRTCDDRFRRPHEI